MDWNVLQKNWCRRCLIESLPVSMAPLVAGRLRVKAAEEARALLKKNEEARRRGQKPPFDERVGTPIRYFSMSMYRYLSRTWWLDSLS